MFVFDSTYNTNDYEYSLVVLCGVINHFSTCIFDSALVAHEDEDGYDWVLSVFLDAMEGKKPCSLVID